MPGLATRNLPLGWAISLLLVSPPLASAADDAVEDEPEASEEVAPWATGDWLGVRDRLARYGVEITLVLQGDPSANLTGGIRQGTAIRTPLQAAVDLDGGSLVGWRGAHVHAGFQALEGGNASDLLVGDVQGFNNVDAMPFRQVSELWLEQRLLGDRLRLKIGKADANADFARVDASGEFLNSSAGYSPTIQGFPSYPDPATSVGLFAEPAGWLSLGAGVYDGSTHEGCHGRTGSRGLSVSTFFGEPHALFVVGEATVRHSLGGRPGRLSVGSWTHTGTFEGLDGHTHRGAAGLYGVAEQRLVQEAGDGDQGLDLFAQVGISDGRLAEFEQHLSVGLSATGALPGRDRDVAGLMLTSVMMSPLCPTATGSRRESVLELYYGVALRPWLVVKPDLQYIFSPGAGGAENAFVGTLRITLAL